jgi:hypothetical protein
MDKREEQVNVRLTRSEASALDERRAELRKERGAIPTRSELIREALLQYLGTIRQAKKR